MGPSSQAWAQAFWGGPTRKISSLIYTTIPITFQVYRIFWIMSRSLFAKSKINLLHAAGIWDILGHINLTAEVIWIFKWTRSANLCTKKTMLTNDPVMDNGPGQSDSHRERHDMIMHGQEWSEIKGIQSAV